MECGNVYKESDSVQYLVSRYSDVAGKLIPFFDKYKIIGVKYQDYQDFRKVVELMKSKDHLRIEGLEEIKKKKKIIQSMNKGRII